MLFSQTMLVSLLWSLITLFKGTVHHTVKKNFFYHPVTLVIIDYCFGVSCLFVTQIKWN